MGSGSLDSPGRFRPAGSGAPHPASPLAGPSPPHSGRSTPRRGPHSPAREVDRLGVMTLVSICLFFLRRSTPHPSPRLRCQSLRIRFCLVFYPEESRFICHAQRCENF